MCMVCELGFCVGLYSVGINFCVFVWVLVQSDWVGFDVKVLVEDVVVIIGVDGSGVVNWCSLECLLDSGVVYECWIMVYWCLFDSECFWCLVMCLCEMGVECFVV